MSGIRREVDLQASHGRPADPHAAQAIAEAEIAIAQLKVPAVPRSSSLPPELRNAYQIFLTRWIVAEPPPVPRADEETALGHLKETTADALLADALLLAGPTGADPIAPAAELLRWRRGWEWEKSWANDLEKSVVRKAGALAVQPTPELASLAVIAATLRVRSAADELARAFLAASRGSFEKESWRTGLLALARLARPGPPAEMAAASTAAAASYSVYTLGQYPDQVLPALAPAILCAPMVDTASVLIRLGQAAYADQTVSDFRSWVAEEDLLGNVTLALCRDRFDSFGRHLGTLLKAPQAKSLLFGLRRTGVLIWRQGDAKGEVDLTVGETIVAALDSIGPNTRTIAGLDETAFKALKMLLRNFQDAGQVTAGTFNAQLRQRDANSGQDALAQRAVTSGKDNRGREHLRIVS